MILFSFLLDSHWILIPLPQYNKVRLTLCDVCMRKYSGESPWL